jgi:geranylgeranyl diphosphate synthase type I
MTAGQHNDLTLQEPSLEQCWQIAAAKSGAWFALACRSGARLATADTIRLERFREFGHHLGVLIQIRDDIDGLWSKDGSRSDLVNWPRWTLPVAYAMTVVGVAERDRLRHSLQAAPTDPDAEAMARHMIIEAGAVLYLAAEAHCHQRYAQKALLQASPPSAACDDLLALLSTFIPVAKP